MENRKKAIEFIIAKILKGERDIDRIKKNASRRFGLSDVIKNPDLLQAIPKEQLTPEVQRFLLKKPTKTSSGVTPVAVMIEPDQSCNYGCIYCPMTGLAAKSYTGFEPAALRARQNNFDSYKQARSRVEQFEGGGHPADKCEIIVMGGTFLEKPEEYKFGFIKGIYDALNSKDSKRRSQTLKTAIDKNEKSSRRAIGLTIETRPDVCIDYIDEMLEFGTTRVELGVQHADDKIYKLINRGHGVKEVIDSTKALKNAAFKVLYHAMPGLPGSTPKKDIGFVKRVFEDQKFRPDMLKIYPTLVIGGTVLKQWVETGKYEPYSTEEAAEVISEFYRDIPSYVRVMRIQRDIPAYKIEHGVKKSNLRELVEAKIREKGIIPKEIRYREIGLQNIQKKNPKLHLERFDYDASDGKEVFLSFENEEKHLAGFTRLRIPGDSVRKEIDSNTALIRELHVYGLEASIGATGKVQHKGLGTQLLEEAERIAKEEFGREKMIIISGIGVREYYRKKGYERVGPYMGKKL